MNIPFNKYKWEIVLAAVFVIVLIAVTKLPLFNVTGYEFSAFNAILLFLIALFTGLNKKYRASSKIYKLTFGTVVISLPLIISLISTILFSICPLDTNSFFYFVITTPVWFFGLITASVSRALSKHYSYLIGILIFLLFVLIPVLEFYFYPMVYVFNPVIGFIPGTIYDEDFSITNRLLVYRAVTILIFISLWYLSSKNYAKKGLVLVFTGYLVFVFFKPELGFASTEKTIYDGLGSITETANFTIYHSDRLDEDQQQLLRLTHEFYFQRLSDEMGYHPESKITSFVFPNSDVKKKLFGSRNADFAKTWANQIFIEERNTDATLKHELVHIFAAEKGTSIFKAAENLNFAMIEGYAMAYENDIWGKDLDYAVSLAFNNGFKVSMERLFSGLNFFGNASSLSYMYSGSFMKFLKREYGAESINSLYADINFEKYTGKSLTDLEHEFTEYIATLPKEINKHRATIRYGYKPLTKKVCPRFLASRRADAWKLYNAREYKKAAEVFENLIDYSEDNSSITGFTLASIKLKKLTDAKLMLEERIDEYENTAFFYNLELLLGDIYALNGDSLKADSLYNLLVMQNPSDSYFAAAKVRIMLLNENLMNDYLDADNVLRRNILFELFNKKNDYYILSRIIRLSSEYDDITEGLLNNLISENQSEEIPSWISENISIFCLNNIKFEMAKNFCASAIASNRDKYREYRLDELMMKINYIDERFDN